jgi:hypothetical protein
MFAGKLKHLRRPASSGPDSRKRRFEKAKPSTVAAAVSGPSPSFLATQNGRELIKKMGKQVLCLQFIRCDFFGNNDHFEPDLGIVRFFPYITFGDVLQGGALLTVYHFQMQGGHDTLSLSGR